MKVETTIKIWFSPQWIEDAHQAVEKYKELVAQGSEDIYLATDCNLIHADVLLYLTEQGFKICQRCKNNLGAYYLFIEEE